MIVVGGEALIDVIRTPDGHEQSAPGGGPFTAARAIARLGAPVSFLGHLSHDGAGRQLRGLLAADGVKLDLTSVGPEPTTRAIALLRDEGRVEYEFELAGTSAPNLTAEMVPQRLADDVDAIHLGSLGLVLEPLADSLLGLLKRSGSGRLVLIDPNVRPGLIPDSVYRDRMQTAIAQSTIVKTGEMDVAWLYPGLDPDGAAAAALLGAGPKLVIVTLGDRGSVGFHGELRVAVRAPRVNVVDTIGCGDAFGAGVLAWLHDHRMLTPDLELSEAQLRAMLDFASWVAALNCTHRGADPPWRHELA